MRLVELGQLLDALIGGLQLDAAPVEDLAQGGAEQAEEGALADHQHEAEHRGGSLQTGRNRQSDRQVRAQEHQGKSTGGKAPGDHCLVRGHSQRSEREDQKQHGDERDPDRRNGEQEHQLQRHMRRDLEDSEVVIFEAVAEAGFRQHGERPDDQEAAQPEQRGHGHGDRAGIAVEQQDGGAQRIARHLADIHLAALPGPADQDLRGRRLGRKHEIRDLSSIPLGKGRRGRAHDPANGGCQRKNLRGKPLGLVSFETESEPCSAEQGDGPADEIRRRPGISLRCDRAERGLGETYLVQACYGTGRGRAACAGQAIPQGSISVLCYRSG